jgi:hypothetical protein
VKFEKVEVHDLEAEILMLVDLLKKVVLRVKLTKMLVNESPENKRSNLGDMGDECEVKIEM